MLFQQLMPCYTMNRGSNLLYLTDSEVYEPQTQYQAMHIYHIDHTSPLSFTVCA